MWRHTFCFGLSLTRIFIDNQPQSPDRRKHGIEKSSSDLMALECHEGVIGGHFKRDKT